MKLTKNEKKALKLLLENGKISDSNIAEKLKISSQAVGKIRKKLESTIIDSYTISLNYSKLGIKTFSISLSKITSEGKDLGELNLEKKLMENPNIIQVFRLPTGNYTHIIFYGFTDIDEMDSFFHTKNNIEEIHKYIEPQELFTFSNHSLIKNNTIPLFLKIIEEFDENKEKKIKAFENFKKRLK